MGRRIMLYVIIGILVASNILISSHFNSEEIYYAISHVVDNEYTLIDANEHYIPVDKKDFENKCSIQSEYYKLHVNAELEIVSCSPWSRDEIPKRVVDELDALQTS